MDKELMKIEITKLIEKYNREKGKKYNEEATKDGFIKPLFTILGWNFSILDEVSPEDKVSKKRVDYALKIGGIPKFFLEAKPLNEELDGYRIVNGEKVTYAEQAVNYAYYSGCDWAVLTNFNEVRIYDAGIKINPNMSLRMSLRIDLFINDFEDGLYLLSKEAFEQGLLDKKYGTKTRKRPISEQLLADFTAFRALLSKNVYALNKKQNLSEEELDEAIQRLFDRLIFIRNCEDKEFEPPTLSSTIRQWTEGSTSTLISEIRKVFADYNTNYDSKIFGEHKGEKHLCDQIEIGDEALGKVIKGLYTTEDGTIQYDFSLIDADILGSIYEQYLGHILKRTEKRTKLTESRAKRKEEGIYYTPSYIVDYIVRNTVEEIIKKKNVDVSKIKVLDPACGSGSFLIKTFDVLNEYYSKQEGYNQNKLDMSGTGTTYSTKLSILKDNIFGVDLDKQAVDIAQLNLLLKVAEKKRRLPLLQQNIKNGNSLIDDPNLAGDKAFKWNEEFAEIMNNGGFDVIVGNPPYISNKEIAIKDKICYRKNYKFATKQFDIYTLFIESAYRHLKEGGRFGFIIPDAFLSRSNMSKLREFLLRETSIESIFILNNVFADPSVASAIIIFKKDRPNLNHILKFTKAKDLKDATFGRLRTISIKQNIFLSLPDNAIIFATNNQIDIIKKIKSNCKLLVEFSSFMFRGEELGKEASVITSNAKDALMFLAGEDIGCYNIKFSNKFIKKSNVLKGTERYLQKKIVIRQIGDKINATFDSDGKFITIQSVYNIIVKKDLDPKCILGIINSKVIEFYYKLIFGSKQLFPRILLENLKQLPIKEVPEKDVSKLATLVDKILNLNKELRNLEGKMTDNTIKIEEEIQKTDTEINELIYKIYGITEEEKKIIEESIVSKKIN